MNPFERNAFDFSTFGKAFTAPFETANPSIAAMQQWNSAVLRAGLEVAGFWSRRARASIDAPHRYAACRTMQDVASVNAELTTAAMRDMTETAQRTMGLLATPTMAAAGKPGNGFAAGRSPRHSSENGAEVADAPDVRSAYEWWRTDMKAIKPRRNGHASDAEDARSGH